MKVLRSSLIPFQNNTSLSNLYLNPNESIFESLPKEEEFLEFTILLVVAIREEDWEDDEWMGETKVFGFPLLLFLLLRVSISDNSHTHKRHHAPPSTLPPSTLPPTTATSNDTVDITTEWNTYANMARGIVIPIASTCYHLLNSTPFLSRQSPLQTYSQ